MLSHSTHRSAPLTRSRCGVVPLVLDGHKGMAMRSMPRRGARQASIRGRGSLVAAAVPKETDVVVVGAGVAGLSAALHLQKKGVKDIAIIESSDAVGGRVRSDVVDGYILDRGFQIFLTSYPESQALLDYPALDLKPFYAGALVWWNGDFHRVADPVRHLLDGILSLTNPIGSVADKVKVGIFRLRCLLGSADELLMKEEVTTAEKLKAEGFSDDMIKRFFRPFLGGIFFDRGLSTSSRLFEWVMRMLATGANSLPAAGIGAITKQMESRLPSDVIHLGSKVEKVISQSGDQPAQVVMADGTVVTARKAVVVAVEGPEAKRLLGGAYGSSPSKDAPGVGTCNLYFNAPKPPSQEPILFLNGEDEGIVNNCCFPSQVAPSYAPAGKTLVSVSTIGTFDEMSDTELEAAVRQHLSKWFGPKEVESWVYMRTYRIPFAQPNQAPPTNFFRPVSLGSGVYVCGDHRDSATFDGAIKSGKRAADAISA